MCKKCIFWKNGKKITLPRWSQAITMEQIRVRVVENKRWNFQKNPSTGSLTYTGGVSFLRRQKRSKMPFSAVLGRFWPFWGIFNCFKLQQMKCLHNRKKISKKKSRKKFAFLTVFWPFLAVFGRFGHFGLFLAVFELQNVREHVIYPTRKAHY